MTGSDHKEIAQKYQLTSDEVVEICETAPALYQAMESGGIAAVAWLVSWKNRIAIPAEAQRQAQEIRKTVSEAATEQASLFTWCGFPTDMTRVSPFFPIKTNELGERAFLRDELITAAQWGEIRYTGPKLSVAEEDSLLALLAILEASGKHRTETTHEGRKTYTYHGPALPLLALLHGKRRPTGRDYKRLVASLELLAVAGVKLSLSARTKTGKRKEPRFTTLSSMLSNVAWDEEKKELSVTVNPFFYETYFAGAVTLIDVQKRMSIKGSIAKSLYRFVQSHKTQSPLWTGHFLTLAQALNMDIAQPAYELRRQLKEAVNELIKQKILSKQSRFLKQDIITFYRSSEALPKKTRQQKSPSCIHP